MTRRKLDALSPIDKGFACVMEKPKRIILKSHRYQMIQKAYRVRGFTRGKDGKDHANGINFTVFGEFVGIKHLGTA